MFGKKWKEVSWYIGTKTQLKTRLFGRKMCDRYKKDPTLEGAAEFLTILNKPLKEDIPWTDLEKTKFIEGLRMYGKSWKKI